MAKQQQTRPKTPPRRSEATNELGYPQSVDIAGCLLGFHGVAVMTKDGLYTGTNGKGEQIHAIVCHPDAHDNQAAYLNRGS